MKTIETTGVIYGDGNVYYEDITYNGIVVGCHVTNFNIKDMKYKYYQMGIKDTKKNRETCDFWMHSEDNGWIFICYYLKKDFENKILSI